MLILGLNMFHADASAAIIQDGEVIFAIAEERLNRIKHYAGFPSLAIKACLDAAGAKMTDVDHVAVGQDSDANLSRKVQYALANPAKILNFIRLRQHKEAMRDVRSLIATSLGVDPAQLRFQEHHLEHHIAHIASAYYCSPWEKAAGFSYDGSGDFVSTMIARCEGKKSEITQRDMDLAYAMQHCFEEAFFHLLNNLHKKVPLDNLAMAGGCALNSVANGKLFARTPFKQTWIQPAAGDEGLAIGAALHTYHSVLKQPRRYAMKNSYLGPEFSDSQIECDLKKANLRY